MDARARGDASVRDRSASLHLAAMVVRRPIAQSALFALMLQELPACAAMESLCQTCVQRVLSGRRSGVAHHDETLALEDVVYLLYLVMGHLKGHSLRCSYASEDMSAWPTADWQAVTECFEALEKDFGSFDERGVADGFVDIDAIAKALPLRAKASCVSRMLRPRTCPCVRHAGRGCAARATACPWTHTNRNTGESS